LDATSQLDAVAREPFARGGAARHPEHERLEIFIGRWINEGCTLDGAGGEDRRILTSDVYEWMPGRFFVLHTAYGRIGDQDVGGTEILGYDAVAGEYWTLFFDSSGGIHRGSLSADGQSWTWRGEAVGCTAVFSDGGRVQTAHHIRRGEDGQWVPSMEVVLRKIT
jgi:Protein of unknown function (DUF1579)